jgi:hypothetical protein
MHFAYFDHLLFDQSTDEMSLRINACDQLRYYFEPHFDGYCLQSIAQLTVHFQIVAIVEPECE